MDIFENLPLELPIQTLANLISQETKLSIKEISLPETPEERPYIRLEFTQHHTKLQKYAEQILSFLKTNKFFNSLKNKEFELQFDDYSIGVMYLNKSFYNNEHLYIWE